MHGLPALGGRQPRPPGGLLCLLLLVAACGHEATPPETTPGPVARVTIAGLPPSLVEGDSVQLQATAQDAAGYVVQVPITWLSSDPAVVSLTPTGLLRAIGPGTADVVAQAADRQDRRSVTVARRTIMIEITAGDGVTDTIFTLPLQALVATVRDTRGRPEVGVQVRFEVPAEALGNKRRMTVGQIGSQSFGASVVQETDGQGRAGVRVQLGNVPGAALVVATVPLHGLADTARFTVLPGAPARVIIAPRDSTLLLGTGVTLRTQVVDQALNPRSESPTHEAVGDILAVQGGVLMPQRVGKALLRASYAAGNVTLRDSTSFTVVPPGTLAWTGSNSGVRVGGLAGNNTLIGTIRAIHPAWSPDGSRIAFINGETLYLSDLQGASTVVALPGARVQWPEYASAGDWIYMEGRVDSGLSGIYRVRPNGTGFGRVSPAATAATQPTVSPDGGSIAYVVGNDLVVQVLGGVPKVLVAGGLPAGPRWSPDGKRIAYTRRGAGELMVAAVDGSGPVRMGEHGLVTGIAWSPDSRWIVGFEQRATLVDVQSGKMLDLTWSSDNGVSWRRF